MSVSTSRGSSGAMAVTSAGSRSPAVAPSTEARTSRSSARRSTRSPPREASAASSSAVSRAASSRGASPTRPAELRPVSSTRRTWRSRSGRQVRTTSSVERAEARQSIERTSSPATYSRSESNSVPWPRTWIARRPSSSRSRASREGRWRRDPNGGSTRTRAGTARPPCRAASPSGPSERTVTRTASRSPRRVGVSVVTTRRRSPAGTTSRCRAGTAPAEGCQASRSTRRARRRPGVGHPQRDLERRPEAQGRRPGRVLLAVEAHAPDGDRRQRVHDREQRERPGHGQDPEQRRHEQPHDQRAEGHQQGETPGDGHVVSPRPRPVTAGPARRRARPDRTPSAVTPSSSASGRSATRWRSAGRASALTSSGVT